MSRQRRAPRPSTEETEREARRALPALRPHERGSFPSRGPPLDEEGRNDLKREARRGSERSPRGPAAAPGAARLRIPRGSPRPRPAGPHSLAGRAGGSRRGPKEGRRRGEGARGPGPGDCAREEQVSALRGPPRHRRAGGSALRGPRLSGDAQGRFPNCCRSQRRSRESRPRPPLLCGGLTSPDNSRPTKIAAPLLGIFFLTDQKQNKKRLP